MVPVTVPLPDENLVFGCLYGRISYGVIRNGSFLYPGTDHFSGIIDTYFHCQIAFCVCTIGWSRH